MGDLPGRRLRHRPAADRAAGRRRPSAPATSASATSSSARAGSSTATSGRRSRPTTARPTGSASTSPSTRPAPCPTRTAAPTTPTPAASRSTSSCRRSRSTRSRCRRSTVSDVVIDEQDLSFHVDKVGVPVLVKVSYFPNWTAHGAEGPYRIAPNLMVVVPTSQRRRADVRPQRAPTSSSTPSRCVGIAVADRRRGSGATWSSTPVDRRAARRRRRWPSPAGTGGSAMATDVDDGRPGRHGVGAGVVGAARPDAATRMGADGDHAAAGDAVRFVMWMTIRRPMPGVADGPAGAPTSLTARHVCARRDRQGLRRPRDGARPAQRPVSPARSGSPSPATPARPSCSSAATCGRPGRRSSTRSPTACAARASTWSTSGWRRRTWCTSPPATSTARAPSSPPRTTRPSTTASSSASRAPARSASTGSARSRPWPARCSTATARADAAARRVAPRAGPAAGVRRARPVVRRRRRRSARCASSPTPPTGWAASSCRPCSSGSRRSSSR